MKKSLIALAAMAAAGASMAQSSVTLYGVLDAGIRNDSAVLNTSATTPGATSLTNFANGVLNTSRFGMRGTEDLGDGMKANFNLESGLAAGTGASSQANTLFDRRAVVGVQGGWGRVDLGRNTTLTYDMTSGYVTDPLGQEYTNQNSQVFAKATPINPVGLLTGNSGLATVRRDNAVKYLGTFGPVSVGVMYAIGGVVGNSTANTSTQGMLRYKDAAIDAALAYDSLSDAYGNKQNVTTVGGNYRIGAFLPTIGYHEIKADKGVFSPNSANPPLVNNGTTPLLSNSGLSQLYTYIKDAAGKAGTATTTGMKATVTNVGLGYDVSPTLNIVGAYYKTQFSADGFASQSYDTYIVRAKYFFSKSTFAYAGVDYTSTGIAAAYTANKSSTNATGLSAGLQTRF